RGRARERSEGPAWHHHTGPYPRGGPVPQKGKGTGPSNKCARREGWSNLTSAFFPVVTETSPPPGHRGEETPSRCFPCSGRPDETVGGADGDHDERGQGQQRVVEPACRTPPAVHPHGHGKAQGHHGQGDGQGQGEGEHERGVEDPVTHPVQVHQRIHRETDTHQASPAGEGTA